MEAWLERFDIEATALARAVTGTEALGVAAVLVLIWALAFAARNAIRLRSGLLSDHPISLALVDAVAVVLSTGLVARHFYRAAPLLVTSLGLVVGTAVTFAFGLRARAWLAGFAQVMVSRVRPGDRLSFESATGVVQRLGLFRLRLRDGGRTFHVPISALDGASFSVSSPERSHPVEVSLFHEGAVDSERLQEARTAVILCPYRDPQSRATVEIDPNDPSVLRARFAAWSEGAAGRAQDYVRAVLDVPQGP